MSDVILLVLNKKRIEEGWLTEPVVFFIGHYIHYKTMFFLFNSVLYFPHNYHMVKEEGGGGGYSLEPCRLCAPVVQILSSNEEP